MASSCPYAAVISTNHSEDESEHSDTSKLLHSCPAFAEQKCPFAGCTTDEEIRNRLLQIPQNHLNDNSNVGTQLKQIFQKMHTISPSHGKYVLNSCPVNGSLQFPSLQDAMEEYSLAHIMAKMASTRYVDDENEEDNTDRAPEQLSQVVKEVPMPMDIPDPPVLRESLSKSFKTGTAVSHEAAENVHFVRNFIQGIIDRDLYAELVVQLFYVYESLEKALGNCSNDHVLAFQPFHDALRRQPALEEDLDFWHDDKTCQTIHAHQRLSPATQDYVNRIEHITQSDPLLLISHSYTRYLGDLSGGKILARVAKRAMHLSDMSGLAFYEFNEIKSAKLFKDDFRRKLDELPLTEAQVSRLVAEANLAFLLNMRIFEELDVMANVPGSKVRSLEDAMSFVERHQTVATPDASAECPFLKPQQETKSRGRCPWPFIILHDPKAALQDWQTWVVLGLVLCYAWSLLVPYVKQQ